MRISIADLPSLSPLVRDYYYAYEEVSEFYNGDFRDPSAFEGRSHDCNPESMRESVWLRF